jgi:hypothetical protein
MWFGINCTNISNEPAASSLLPEVGGGTLFKNNATYTPNDIKSVPENCYLNAHQHEKVKSDTAKNAFEFVCLQMYNIFDLTVTVLRDVTPCCPVDMYQCFRGTPCIHHQGRAGYIYSCDGGSRFF